MKRRQFTRLLGAAGGIATLAPWSIAPGVEGLVRTTGSGRVERLWGKQPARAEIRSERGGPRPMAAAGGGDARFQHELDLEYGDVRVFVAL